MIGSKLNFDAILKLLMEDLDVAGVAAIGMMGCLRGLDAVWTASFARV
ncbi:MAG: hypothetical protein HC849_13405 [Oscillatoriales cyanobacterium RU_3_3]|nr:hypothetical protein [Microcoleus sp. SU_5_3]NJM60974.1 hypothetical protein [Oscillatoriales cyanobacterium RU_3_3]NJS42196.1 hypothetical protein [Candidatus Gracilibacteria bacterium]